MFSLLFCFAVVSVTGKRGAGIPIVLLHDSMGGIVTVELKNGSVYRGTLDDAQDNMNCLLKVICDCCSVVDLILSLFLFNVYYSFILFFCFVIIGLCASQSWRPAGNCWSRLHPWLPDQLHCCAFDVEKSAFFHAYYKMARIQRKCCFGLKHRCDQRHASGIPSSRRGRIWWRRQRRGVWRQRRRKRWL